MALRRRTTTYNQSKKRFISVLIAAIVSPMLLGSTSFSEPLQQQPQAASIGTVDATKQKLVPQESKKPKRQAKKKEKAEPSSMSWVQLQQHYPGAFVLNGPRNKRKVALTFDDAPDSRFTPAVLDILAQYKVCATFFVVGDRASKHPELVKRMKREGHLIGNHSYNHAVLSKLQLTDFKKQLSRTDTIISGIIGYHPRFVRPPYGDLLPSQVAWTKKAGYTIVNWDVDSVDWKDNPSSSLILSNIKSTLQPGSIILQHAGGGEGQSLSGTIEALPELIKLLRSRGYEIVTLSELLGQPPRMAKKQPAPPW